MRRILTSAAVVCMVIGSAQPAVWGKKDKEDVNARLRSLRAIYVDGSRFAVAYISENLPHETCLDIASDKTEADAILEVWEESPVPCGIPNQPTNGVCSHIQAKLFDAKTKKLLWYREDQHFPLQDMVHQQNGPYQWVLWNLKSSCCKNRPSTDFPPPSKE